MEVVKLDGSQLEYASAELRRRRDLVIAAMQNNSGAFGYASQELRNDITMANLIPTSDISTLSCAGPSVLNNFDIMIRFTKDHRRTYDIAGPALKGNHEFSMACIHKNGNALGGVWDHFRADKAFVRKVLEMDGLAIKHANYYLKKDMELILVAMKQNVDALSWACIMSMSIEETNCLESIKKYGWRYVVNQAEDLCVKLSSVAHEINADNPFYNLYVLMMVNMPDLLMETPIGIGMQLI